MKLKLKVVQALANLYSCEEDEESISRQVYKNTDCGAWFAILKGIPTLGTIVEGSDAEMSCAYEGDGSIESITQWHDETIKALEDYAEENFDECS